MAAREYAVGILFVHGMGEQERGDTVTEMGDALTEWLRRWLEPIPDADFRIREATLRVGHDAPPGTSDHAVGGQAHVSATIIEDPRGENRRQEWLLAESWWAHAFRPASFTELVTWAIAVGPWLIASQRAGIGQRFRGAGPARFGAFGAVGEVVLGLGLTVVAALVASVIAPLAIGLLALSLIPIPVVSGFIRGLVKNLSGSFGDLLVLVRSPVRFAAMAEQVRGDIASLAGQCDRVMVVAHSQGSAVAWHAIRRMADLPTAQRREIALFVSFGQAFRKLKSLHRIHRAPGATQAWFTLLALLSTVLLLVTAATAIRIVAEAISAPAPMGDVMAAVGPQWQAAGLSLLVVVVLQGILARMATTVDAQAERQVIEEIGEVSASLPGFRWLDLWASADPAPNGQLLTTPPANVDTYKIRNLASTILDHSVYWHNTTEFVSAIAFSAASLAPPSPIGTRDPVPHELQRAAILRDHRVSMLSAARVLWFTGAAIAIFGARDWLAEWGEAVIGFMQGVPLLGGWFNGWSAVAAGLLAAALGAVGALVVWSLQARGWNVVTGSDERAFFARRPGRVWSGWAIAWMAISVVVASVPPVAVAVARGDPGTLIAYVVTAAIGLPIALLALTRGGRRLDQARPEAEAADST